MTLVETKYPEPPGFMLFHRSSGRDGHVLDLRCNRCGWVFSVDVRLALILSSSMDAYAWRAEYWRIADEHATWISPSERWLRKKYEPDCVPMCSAALPSD